MTKPTAFGFSGSTALVGGEAGPEAILPLDRIQGYFDKAVKNVLGDNRQGDIIINMNAEINNEMDIRKVAEDLGDYIYRRRWSGSSRR